MKASKNTQLLLRLSEADLEQIQANAEACGKTVSAYVRETALNMCVINIDNTPITKHTNEISSYRNAVNQLIFAIKKNGNYTPADLEYILEKTSLTLKSEKEFLNTYSLFIENLRKAITRTVRQVVKKAITK